MFILAYDADSEEFSKIGDYWVYAIVVYWSLGCVLLVRTYLNYRSDEDNTLRNASIAAGLIFFAFMGAGTLRWPFLFSQFPLPTEA